MNIKLRLAEDGELEDGPARGPTLEFVLENQELFLKEEEEEEEEPGGPQKPQQGQFGSKASDQSKQCSADSSQSANSDRGPDASP